MRVLVSLLALGTAACAGSSAAVADAVVNTAIAATAAGVNRANGHCYAICPPTTQCNRATGYCDPLPCGGSCLADERCEEPPTGPPRCVPRITPRIPIPGEGVFAESKPG